MRRWRWLAWFRPPRHLIVLFVGITTVSAGALGWLGWQLVQQDRALAKQRASERLENAVGPAVATLQQRLTEIDAALTDLAAAPEGELASRARNYGQQLGADSVLLVFSSGGIDAEPPNRLLYHPTESAAWDRVSGVDAVFADVDALELRQTDPAKVIPLLERLSRSETPAVQAEALVRLARNLRKTGRSLDAERAYERLANLGAVRMRGIPSDLVARDALATLYEERGDAARLTAQASSLLTDLHTARWEIDRQLYAFYEPRTRRRLGTNAAPTSPAGSEALADVAFSLWTEWREGRSSTRPRAIWTSGRSVLAIQRSSPERMAALLAGPDFIRTSWLAELAPLATTHGARIALRDEENHDVAGPAGAPPSGPQYTSASTGLPWTLSVLPTTVAPTDLELAQRRQLIIGGLLAIVLFVVGGSYLIGRAVVREVAVAQVQSDFVAAVSHEFRTPLTALRQISELLARGRVPSDAVRQEYYDVLEHETSRLHRLVEGLLKFGRMEAGVADYQFETVDAAVLLRSLVGEFEAEAHRHGCRVEFTVEDAVPALRADREALNCVVWNLLDNAAKYSPNCCTVWIDLRCENGDVAIRVRDRGVGISPDDRERVFEKFVRGETARSLGVQGTGIGLAVSQQIVASHGGRIHLDSEPGKGSTFTVLLPALAEATA